MTSGFELQMPSAFSQIDLNTPIENDGESKLSEPVNSQTPQTFIFKEKPIETQCCS